MIFRERNGRAPGHGCPIDKGDVLCLRFLNRNPWILSQQGGKAAMLRFQPPKSIITRAKIEVARPVAQRMGLGYVLWLNFFGRLLNVNVGVLRVSAGSCEEHTAVFGTLCKQSINKLEAEGNCLPDKFGVIVRSKGCAAVRQ